MRETLGFTTFLQTFTPAARLGNLPGRTVPVNPDVVPYVALWPQPGPGAVDQGDGTAREALTQSQPTDEDFFQGRIDHNFSDTDAIYGRVTRQVSTRFRPEAIERWGHENTVYNMFTTIEERKIFSAAILNTFRFGFNRRGVKENSTESPGVDPALFFVSPENWRYPLGAEPILGSLSVPGVSAVGLGRGWVDRKVDNYQFVNDLVYNRGSQVWKFGFSWLHSVLDGDNPSRPGGEVFFGSIDDFLRGRPRQFRGDILPETDSLRTISWNVIGWYVQNDWRVNPRLTLNLGLRHEFYTVPTEKDDKISNLRDPLNDTEPSLGDPWWENPSYGSFAPRVGFALDPTGSGKTAVRGGGGLFFNNVQPEAFRQAAYRTAPFALETNYRAAPGVIPFPDLFDFIVDLGAAQGDMHIFPYDYARNPHMIQWNLNVQHEVFPQTAVTVGYAGSRGLNLTNQVARNTAQAEIINGRYVFPLNAARPNRAFDLELTSRENASDSWYHSLQLELQRRFQAGYQLQFSYTHSKTVDEASQYNPTFNNDGGGVVYYWDPDLRRGLAAFHVANKFSAGGVWQLPFGAGKRFGSAWPGWVDRLLGGWQVGGIVTLTDGPPATISISSRTDLANIGLGGDSPDLVPGGNNNPVLGDPDRYFDTSQFLFPPPRTIGDVGRNTLIAPGLATVDMSLTKNMPLFGTTRAQFRVEFFNLLNRANLGLPNTTVFDATGRPVGSAGFIETTTTTARQIQLGVRFEW
jgi:hypothetical protein